MSEFITLTSYDVNDRESKTIVPWRLIFFMCERKYSPSCYSPAHTEVKIAYPGGGTSGSFSAQSESARNWFTRTSKSRSGGHHSPCLTLKVKETPEEVLENSQKTMSETCFVKSSI
jgi:hypothetical protein